jgi:hypothetical protein
LGKYVVIGGPTDRPPFLDGQHIEKGSGQTLLVGEPVKYTMRKQDIGIPNYALAWGVRVFDDGKIPESPVDVKDPKYHGQVQFLEWGDKKGTLIECRYLKNYGTLDKQYQELVLNAKIDVDDPSSADAFFINIQSGENSFDETTEPMKIQMLKISSYNLTSKFKNPDAVHWLYKEKNEAEEKKVESKSLDAKTDALRIVNEASMDNSYQKLTNLLGVVRGITTEEPEEKDIYVFLQKLADAKPDLFISKVNEHKKFVSNIFEKAKSYEIIDLTKDGVIVAGQNKKDIIAEDIPAKGEGMLTWLLENFLDAKANEAIFKLKKINDKLK